MSLCLSEEEEAVARHSQLPFICCIVSNQIMGSKTPTTKEFIRTVVNVKIEAPKEVKLTAAQKTSFSLTGTADSKASSAGKCGICFPVTVSNRWW
ncbi:hypothetical protein V6N13_018393 [Hibiscus sabdariffa]